MSKFEFFFDLSSPWTRIAFHNIQPIIEETGTRVIWRPFLVGGVFNAVNKSVYEGRANLDNPKVRHIYTSLLNWAKLSNVTLNFPSPHHPIKSVLPMRVCCALEDDQERLFKFSSAVFDAYFVDSRNIDDPAELISIANDCGFDGSDLLRKANTQPIKDQLRRNTDEAINRGAFGSPTMFVNDTRLFFGNDELPLVKAALLNQI